MATIYMILCWVFCGLGILARMDPFPIEWGYSMEDQLVFSEVCRAIGFVFAVAIWLAPR